MNLFLTRDGETLIHFGFYSNYGRVAHICFNGGTLDVSGGGIIYYDVYNLSNGLTDGMERLLHPLNKINVPVHEVAMMMSIAYGLFRFFWRRLTRL